MKKLLIADLKPKYNCWTPLRFEGKTSNNTQFVLCRCDCGKEKRVKVTHLRSGASTNCGCKRRKDLIGKTYCLLTVKNSLGVVDEQQHLLCQCKCGGEKEVKYDNLVRGNTKSCGCLNSEANSTIANWLTLRKIPFEREYTDYRCRNIRNLPFDFAIKQPLKLIEFQGYHHYHTIKARGGFMRLERTKKHDQIKKEFCSQNSIPLLIIPYWERGNMFELIESFIKTN